MQIIDTLAALVAILAGLVGVLKWVAGRRAKRRQDKLRREFERPERMNARKVVGRDDDVRAIRDMLLAGGQGAIVPVPTVTGGGGIGKTTLARHYMAVYRDCYDRAEVIRAATEAQLVGDLAGLADRMAQDNAPIPPETRAHHALDMITERTKTETWLMVLDNVEDPQVLRKWLPEGRNLHLLVTSRHPDWPAEGFATRPAGVLSVDSAVALLAQEAGRQDPDMPELAQAVGYLPLALVQAGEWLADHPRKSAADYMAQLERLLDARQPVGDDYDRATGAVVRLTLEGLSRDARAVMGVLVWFAPDDILQDSFEVLGTLRGRLRYQRWFDTGLWHLRAICRDEARLTAVWRELRLKALIEDDATREGVCRMHRVTQLVGRRALGRVAKPGRATALLAAVYPGQTQDSANWPLCRRLTPHVRALWGTGAAPRSAAMAYLLNQAGLFLRRVGDYAGGLALAEASFEVTKALHAPADRAYAAALHNLGKARLNAGDRDGALRALRQVVELSQTHRPGTEELAVSLDQLGLVLERMARAGQREHLPEAVKATQRALALRLGLHGRRAAPVAASLNNLGMLRDTQGRGAAAARLVAASLAINRVVLPEGDARLATGEMNVGAAWLQAGRADLAEPRLREALDIRRAAYVAEPEHPDLRDAAGWLISCLLVRAAAGEDAAAREAEARRLCDEFGLDWAQEQAEARQYADTPPA